ncbi:normocyte-binding protein [Solibacillus sp. FSL K6-1523]|uniref:normocyte-binding protein n=1 Tax=Solibacillus sp. FSL K6-1523 TaxID=2921471 RepID=UPI0030FCC9FE
MMKEIIFERLRKIENLEQRQLLKDIVGGVLVNLINYQDDMNSKLENRIFAEIEDGESKTDIYVTISSKDEVDPIHEYLFPIIPADLEHKKIDMKEVLDSVSKNQPTSFFSLFLQCDSLQLKQLDEQQRLFNGQLHTTDGQVEVKVCLKKNVSYIQEINNLYHLFSVNGLYWKTVNNPYIHKFFDVVLVDCPPLNANTEIKEITINLEEFENKKRLDMVPLWNIERLEIKNIGFPTPAIDKVNYEHVLSIRKTGSQHGYLVDVDGEDIRYIKRSENELTIVSPQDKSGLWKVLKITEINKEKIGDMNYEVVSNKRVDSFMNKFANKYMVSVKTKAEIIRLVNSFEAAEKMKLVDVEIINEYQGESFYNPMNPFLIDPVGEHSGKKVMLLSFKAEEEKNFISNDILDFFVSEVQRHFFEYKCEGIWI